MSIGLGLSIALQQRRGVVFNPLLLFLAGADGVQYTISDHDGDLDPVSLFASGETGAQYTIADHEGNP